jgi:hypothetical protein
VKIWLCFPGAEPNLKLWAQYLGTEDLLMQYGQRLKGGLIIRTSTDPNDNGNCITLRAGTIHAVFTLEGGFIGGINYSTHKDLPIMCQCIIQQLSRTVEEGILVDIKWLEKTIKHTIHLDLPGTILKTFSNLAKIILAMRQYPERDGKEAFKSLYALVKRSLQQWRNASADKNGNCHCDCGVRFGPSIKELVNHFTTPNGHYLEEGERMDMSQ